MINALSIDLEDWYYPEFVRDKVPLDARVARIGPVTDKILNLLDHYRIRATFFVLGEVAAKDPALIKRIHSSGHEIACHGMCHRPLQEMDRETFAAMLDEFAAVMRHILGSGLLIKGYRAPSFSLNESTAWALDVLKDKGYRYDSSIFPVKNRWYGVRGSPLGVYRPLAGDIRKDDSDGGILEFPVAVYEISGIRIPVGGGFYYRAIPALFTIPLLKAINKERPFVFYFHPWECDNGIPRVAWLSPAGRFITYYGIGKMLYKLDLLLKSFSFNPLCEVLGI